MKENFIHVAFVIDESGSMGSSKSDVIGGFKKVIDEQKAIKDGKCAVSIIKFATDVQEVFIGKDVNEVEYLNDETYDPQGLTAMNDGIGYAIDKVGDWLRNMKEEDRPEKNLIVIMTDGEENNSKDYSLSKVREMIKHQETKYSWTFLYLGTDISDAKAAKDYGFATRGYSSRGNLDGSYELINASLCSYRTTVGDTAVKTMAFADTLNLGLDSMNAQYENEIGKKIDNND